MTDESTLEEAREEFWEEMGAAYPHDPTRCSSALAALEAAAAGEARALAADLLTAAEAAADVLHFVPNLNGPLADGDELEAWYTDKGVPAMEALRAAVAAARGE